MRRRGVEEAADGGNSEFAARCELAGSGEVGPERASGKVETDAELAIAELGDWLADDEFATEGGSEQMETAFEGSAEVGLARELKCHYSRRVRCSTGRECDLCWARRCLALDERLFHMMWMPSYLMQ